MANAPKVSGASGASAPPARAASTVPARIAWNACPMAIAPEAQRVRVADRRPADPQVDRHVRCARPAEDGGGQRGRHGPHAAPHVVGVLLFAEGHAAECRADPDPGPRPRRGRHRSSPPAPTAMRAGHDRELAEAVQPSRALGVQVVLGLEVVDLRGELRGERRGIEAVDQPHRGAVGQHAGPQPVRPMPDGRHRTDAGHGHTSRLSCRRLRQRLHAAQCPPRDRVDELRADDLLRREAHRPAASAAPARDGCSRPSRRRAARSARRPAIPRVTPPVCVNSMVRWSGSGRWTASQRTGIGPRRAPMAKRRSPLEDGTRRT